jgi:ABC-type transport system involved in cytochrome c biogenesis ATPase subunit
MTTTSKTLFWVASRSTARTAKPRSQLVLSPDNWDDFGHKITFDLRFFDGEGHDTYIGPVKILQRAHPKSHPPEILTQTHLPDRFNELDERFASLGQTDEYYSSLRKLLPRQVQALLVSLRDIAWQPALALDLEPTSAYRNALVRFNGAHRARRLGRTLAIGQEAHESFSFQYTFTIEGADTATDTEFSFDSDDRLPGRIVGVIGRNAVGKTRLLAHLASDLAQVSRSSADSLTKRDRRFPTGRPLFTRIMGVSYSAFDQFQRPPPSPYSSYVYCGIRNDRGAISRSSLLETYKRNQERIRSIGRQAEWVEHMSAILGDSSPSTANSLAAEIEASDSQHAFSSLSSGQAILSHFVTALLAWLEPHSLVLFDEPETHLHPNAVASLFSVLARVLATHDSYAIVATHSPLVIQQIPAKRVLVLRRSANSTAVERIPVETFGEGIADLTRHVFETIDVSTHCQRTLLEMSLELDQEQLYDLFPLGLGLSAQAFVLSQYAKRVLD